MRKFLMATACGLMLFGGVAAYASTAHKGLYLYVNMAERGTEHFYNTGWVITSDAHSVDAVAAEAKAHYLPASKGFVNQRTLTIAVGQQLLNQASAS